MFQRFSSLPWLPGILVVAFTIRCGAAVLVQQRVDRSGSLCLIAGDAEGYWMLARHLTRGEDFALYDPPRYAERMPGFPLLLACGMKLLGENALALRVMLALVGTMACGLVYCLGRELVDRATGLIAALLAAVSPIFGVFSVLFLSETAFAAVLMASLVALARVVRGRSAGDSIRGLTSDAFPESEVNIRGLTSPGSPISRGGGMVTAIVAGLLCGAATLVRPTWLLVAPGFAAILVLGSRGGVRRWASAGLVLCGLALALAPWALRNLRATGHLIATTLWMGPSLYDGLSPGATGDSNMQFVEADGWYSRRDEPDFEYQANRHYRQAAVEFAWRNPGRAVALGIHKLWRFANPFPNAAQFGDRVVWWGVGLFETPVLLLAALGGWKLRDPRGGRSTRIESQATLPPHPRPLSREGRGEQTKFPQSLSNEGIRGLTSDAFPESEENIRGLTPPGSPDVSRGASWALILTAGPMLYFALVHTVFVGSVRYRLPVEYPLLILSAVGIRWLVERRVRPAP